MVARKDEVFAWEEWVVARRGMVVRGKKLIARRREFSREEGVVPNRKG